MPSRRDLKRVADVFLRRADRARGQARRTRQQGQAQEAQARQLRQDAEAALAQGALCEEYGLDRQQLFDRLRTLAVARAHALDSRQQALAQQHQAEEAYRRAASLQHYAQAQHGRGRRLAAVDAQLQRQQQQDQWRRQERQTEEEHACR